MDTSWWLVQAAVLLASLLQGATGIGFGVIAGPVLLYVLNSGSAIQVSIMLSLLIALLLAPSLIRQMDRQVLKFLVIGTCLGIPVGILVFVSIDIVMLKLMAGLAVAFMALTTTGVFERLKQGDAAVPGNRFVSGLGVVSGAMSSSLGMPGPVPAAWMITRRFPKSVIRATILIMFVPSYTAALAFQAFTPGISEEGFRWALQLLPATVAGVFAGKLLEQRIGERTFKGIIIVVLSCTSMLLLVDVFRQI
jgi:uncharacterized membrane protein YfcA